MHLITHFETHLIILTHFIELAHLITYILTLKNFLKLMHFITYFLTHFYATYALRTGI